MEITKREIIVSVAIISVMLIFGFFISGKITDYQNDKNAEYQKAVHIDDSEFFQYGMKTNIGNAFVYGDLEAIDTVTYEEIGGEYLYIEKVEERYERHERKVEKEDDEGNKYTEKEVYYEWETENRENKHSEEVRFCGIIFPYKKIKIPSVNYIKTLNRGKVYSWKSGENVKLRFKYYGVDANYTGTIYTKLENQTISDRSPFYKDYTIEETLKKCTSGIGIVFFWIAWIVLICIVVYGFYYLDNRWLED